MILPVVLVFRDRTIDLDGASILEVPFVYVRKGRTLTVKNFEPGAEGTFEFKCKRDMVVHGNIRIMRKAKEMTLDDIRSAFNPAKENSVEVTQKIQK